MVRRRGSMRPSSDEDEESQYFKRKPSNQVVIEGKCQHKPSNQVVIEGKCQMQTFKPGGHRG